MALALLVVPVLALMLLGGCGTVATARPSTSTPPSSRPALPTARDYTATVIADGQKRSAQVHLPQDLAWSAPRPLLLALHGLGQSAADMASMTGFNTLADQRAFIVVYPETQGGGWGMNDTAFITVLLTTLETTLPIDRARIYATGFSEGGFFAEQLACQLADQPFAAIAAVGATIAQLQTIVCRPSHPVAVFLIDGTADQYIPFAGGIQFGYALLSARDTAASWARIDSCGEAKTRTSSGGALPITTTIYHACAYGTSVVLDAIQGGAHVWPGSGDGAATASGLDATATIWDFLTGHPRQ